MHHQDCWLHHRERCHTRPITSCLTRPLCSVCVQATCVAVQQVFHFSFKVPLARGSLQVPRGPTLTMKLKSYSLIRDVQNSQLRPRLPATAFKTAPLVVMNGFSGPEHLKLASSLFQHMFPPIGVATIKLASCQRVVLLNCNKETGERRGRGRQGSAAGAMRWLSCIAATWRRLVLRVGISLHQPLYSINSITWGTPSHLTAKTAK